MPDRLAQWERDALVDALVRRHRVVRAARRVDYDDSETEDDHVGRIHELADAIAALDEFDDGLDDALDEMLDERRRAHEASCERCGELLSEILAGRAGPCPGCRDA